MQSLQYVCFMCSYREAWTTCVLQIQTPRKPLLNSSPPGPWWLAGGWPRGYLRLVKGRRRCESRRAWAWSPGIRVTGCWRLLGIGVLPGSTPSTWWGSRSSTLCVCPIQMFFISLSYPLCIFSLSFPRLSPSSQFSPSLSPHTVAWSSPSSC